MTKQSFSSIECMKMLSFIDDIMVPPHAFREQVLVSLAQIFGYDKTVFWREDETGNVLYDPIMNNARESIINEYLSYYGELDPLHTRKVYDRIKKDNVLRISDVITVKEYENSEFYNNFVKPVNSYYEMGVYLLDGEKLLGSIAIVRSKEEKEFNQKDVSRLQFLSKYISKHLVNDYLFEDMEYQKNAFEYYANESPIGMFLFELPFTIRYFNPAAYEICSRYKSTAQLGQPFSYFIEKYLLNNIQFNWNEGFEQTSSLSGLDELVIKVIAKPSNRHTDGKMFMVFLIPQSPFSMQKRIDEKGMFNQLTKREEEVCLFLKRGLQNEEIAKEMGVSVNTVRKHLQNIYTKMNVKNRTELCYYVT
ncbi:UNVERIFIED_CONTAM: hypothetical protein ABID98_001355 [Brevibacillus sp. OAP136]